MKPLRKYLRPAFLRRHLDEALALLESGSYLAVTDDVGEVLAQAGQAPAEGSELPGPNGLGLDLALEGTVLGRLTVLGNGQTSPDSIAPQARFIHRSLQEILDRESLRRALADETLDQYREAALMQRAVVQLNSSMKVQEVVRNLLDECGSSVFPAEYGMIFLKDGTLEKFQCLGSFCQVGEPALHALSDSRLFREIMEHGKGEIINDLSQDERWQDEIPGLATLLMIPLQAPRIALGALVLASSDQEKTFTAAHLKKASTLASVTGVAMANAYHFEQVQQILMALVKAMATAIDARDRLTAGHSQRVAQYAVNLATRADLDQSLCPQVNFEDTDLQELFYAGLLHDVGKIGVREEVLTKATRLPRPHLELIGLRLALWGELTGRQWQDVYARFEIINKAYELSEEDQAIIHRFCQETLEVGGATLTILTDDERKRLLTPRGNLTPTEWDEIKRHPQESHRILQNIPFTFYFPNILNIILQHHERLDGTGYPSGLAGDDILLQSRILAIVDVYDSLRRDRHYKKALSQEMALTILQQESRLGKLDTPLVELFCRDILDIEKAVGQGLPLLPGPDLLQ